MSEDILDPDLPIIDPHHHLWDLAPLLAGRTPGAHPFGVIPHQTPRYLFEELYRDCREAGHNVVGTVFLQCGAFYRADGPEAMKPVGEVEFVNGVAARSASGVYGPFRACAAIVGHADLRLGSAVGAVLDAEIAAGNGRFRGVRHLAAFDADPAVLGPLAHAPAGLYLDAEFRRGFAELGKRGLTFDAWVIEPQIGELTDLARAIDELASCPNVSVKLGGLAMPFCQLGDLGPERRPTSAQLAGYFRPYLETCIEAFGAARAMFESNFPVDRWGADYATLWNAFKRITRGASADEKRELFAGAAARFYRIEELLA